MTPDAKSFDQLVADAQACRACASMDGQIRVLSRSNGPIGARVMLVGEAPGRLGAGRTGRPFDGDESGRRLDRLMAAAGWRRTDLYITNAVLCNPLDGRGRNRPPRANEIRNCCRWVRAQINHIQPLLVVALGAVALKSLSEIEPHQLTVRESDSLPIDWYDRHLAAVYHPGARAAIHRPVARQLEDFAQLGLWLRQQSINAGNASLP